VKPRCLEDYIKHADDLAQEVVNAWGINVSAGNAATLTTDFKALFEIACQYRTARHIADKHRREFNFLSEQDTTTEKLTRESFAIAYQHYWEKYALVF
jgi:hypothetical protein